MDYNYIALPEDVREWINRMSWGHNHPKTDTFTNKERWLLGLTDAQAWALMKAEPFLGCPLRRTCKLPYSHCEGDQPGKPSKCWEVFSNWASMPINKDETPDVYEKDVANYHIEVEVSAHKHIAPTSESIYEKIRQQVLGFLNSLVEESTPLSESGSLTMHVSDMPLHLRAVNSLWRAGFLTVRDIYKLRTIDELKQVPHLGKKGQAAVIAAMREMGFNDWADKLKMQPKRKQPGNDMPQ
jgi:hypothetical protein